MLNESRVVLPPLDDRSAAVLSKYSQAFGVPMTAIIGRLVMVYGTEGNVFRLVERLAAERRDRKADLAAKRKERFRDRQKAKLSLVR